jgi:hypothetical protein
VTDRALKKRYQATSENSLLIMRRQGIHHATWDCTPDVPGDCGMPRLGNCGPFLQNATRRRSMRISQRDDQGIDDDIAGSEYLLHVLPQQRVLDDVWKILFIGQPPFEAGSGSFEPLQLLRTSFEPTSVEELHQKGGSASTWPGDD